MVLLLTLLGCGPETVGNIEGKVLVGPGVLGSPLVDGQITVLGDDATYFDEAVTDFEGNFRATAPLGFNIHVLVDGEGMETTAFTGTMGLDTFVVSPGDLYGWPEERRAQMDAEFGDCAVPGAVMTGEVRLFGPTDDSGESPLLHRAFARAYNAAGEVFEACYLDDDGVYDPNAVESGTSGRYAIYGLEEGFYELEYGYYITASEPLNHVIMLWVAEDSVVPQYPAWADLPVAL